MREAVIKVADAVTSSLRPKNPPAGKSSQRARLMRSDMPGVQQKTVLVLSLTGFGPNETLRPLIGDKVLGLIATGLIATLSDR